MSRIISHFELLFVKQAPVMGLQVETVLQGYFLELTNLEEKDLLYDVEFVSIPPSSDMANRKLDGNTIAILDNPGASSTDNVFGQLTLVPGTDDTYRAADLELRLASKATAKLAVLPQIAPLPTDGVLVGRNLEVRGYVQISLPDIGGSAQISRAAKIMVTPQSRAAFYDFPSDTDFAGSTIKNQVQASLPTGSGGCVVELEPGDTSFPPA